MIVDKWLSEGYVEMHGKQRENRLVRQGPTHHQGSRRLPAYKQALEAKHPGEELSDFSAWAMSHIGRSSSSISFDPSLPPETYSDPNVYTKVQEYTSAVREIHGEDYDVRTKSIDAEAIMRLGGGKKHGRMWIADGAIDSSTVPNLDTIRARSTSSNQPIRPRPAPTLQQVQELQELTAQQQEKIVELTAQQEAQKAAFEAAQKQMAEMMTIMQNIGQASGVEVHFTAPTPLPAPAVTPVSMKVHFSHVLCMYVGVRAVVDFGVRAVVDVGVRAVLDVGLRAVVSCRFWKPPLAGEVMPKFLTKSNLFVFLDY